MQVVMGKLNGVWLRDLMTQAPSRYVQAAVAYAQRSNPLFDHCKENGVRLEFYGLLDETGAVAPELLRHFLQQGPSRVDCRLVNGLFHPKVIWWHGHGAYIGSANLTDAAWFRNVECGVFYPESELSTGGLDGELEQLFAYLRTVSVPLTQELVERLARLSVSQRAVDQSARGLRGRFDELFKDVVQHRGLIGVPGRGERKASAERAFAQEWNDTLQTLRGLSAEFGRLGLRPSWVDVTAHPAIHFDQFLHAYFYVRIRQGSEDDDLDDDMSTAELVQSSFEQHKSDPGAALVDGARWWASLKEAPYGEDEYIRVTAPGMQRLFSREALASLDRDGLFAAFRDVNAFRMRARQMANAGYGLPVGHHESMVEKSRRLANWLWDRRSAGGRGVREVLEFLIWGRDPPEMERRLWLVTHDEEWKLPNLGPSSLGEAVGWARPDNYPPRNNRTNKALRALGHNVKLFYKD